MEDGFYRVLKDYYSEDHEGYSYHCAVIEKVLDYNAYEEYKFNKENITSELEHATMMLEDAKNQVIEWNDKVVIYSKHVEDLKNQLEKLTNDFKSNKRILNDIAVNDNVYVIQMNNNHSDFKPFIAVVKEINIKSDNTKELILSYPTGNEHIVNLNGRDNISCIEVEEGDCIYGYYSDKLEYQEIYDKHKKDLENKLEELKIRLSNYDMLEF